jgi:hypothetical protein
MKFQLRNQSKLDQQSVNSMTVVQARSQKCQRGGAGSRIEVPRGWGLGEGLVPSPAD